MESGRARPKLNEKIKTVDRRRKFFVSGNSESYAGCAWCVECGALPMSDLGFVLLLVSRADMVGSSKLTIGSTQRGWRIGDRVQLLVELLYCG